MFPSFPKSSPGGPLRWLCGLGIWLALLAGGYFFLTGRNQAATATFGRIGRFLVQQNRELSLTFPEECVVAVGDPIYVNDPKFSVPVGRVVRILPDDEEARDDLIAWTRRADIELYSNAPADLKRLRFHYTESPSSLEWVLATMLPDHKRAEIAKLIVDSFGEHREELWRDLQPLLLSVIDRSQSVIMEDLQSAFTRHQDRVFRIGRKYREEYLDTEVMPVVQKIVMPIIQEETAELAQVIGAELWNRASLWALTWRYLYDRSPLPQRDLTRKEFQRFLRDEALPVVEAYSDEILDAQIRILRRIAARPEMNRLASSLIHRIAADDELRRLSVEIVQEVIVDNPRLREIWLTAWNAPEMQELLQKLNERMGPTVTQIGEALFGNPRKAITPEFSRVLRNKVMFKDLRLLVLDVADDPASPADLVILGHSFEHLPLHIPSQPR